MPLLLGGILLAGLLALAGSAAPTARVLQTVTPVDGLAMDGSVVAVTTAFGMPGTCERTSAWNPVRPTLRPLGRGGRCDPTSTGRSIVWQAVAGSRVAWVTDAGGNQHETRLFVASLWEPRVARQLALATRDVDSGAGNYVGHLHGDGALLVYATWSVCDAGELPFKACPPGVEPGTIYNAKLWRIDGTSKRTLLASAADELAPLHVSAGRILVARENGSLEVRRTNGEVLQTFPYVRGEVRQAMLGPTDLIAGVAPDASDPGGRLGLELYDPTSPVLIRVMNGAAGVPAVPPRCRYPVGSSPVACRSPLPRFRLVDLEARRLVSVLDTKVILTTLANGREQRFSAIGRTPVFAQLEAPGLAYSYRMTTRHKGRVQFVPASQLR